MQPTGGHAQQPRGRPRPGVLRALGSQEPPATVTVHGDVYRLERVLKHDFWAATAVYRSDRRRIICKFHRWHRFGPIPMRWLGKLLARRERRFLRKLCDVPGIPGPPLPFQVDGRPVPNGVARPYIDGRPIRKGQRLPEEFFTRLDRLLCELHARNVAYVDLNKRENVLVASNGDPYLFDFQISFAIWRDLGWLDPRRPLLRLLQASDRYHFEKLRAKHIETASAPVAYSRPRPPWWICLHRMIAVPIRELRRRLLVLFGVRTGKGRVTSEHFIEDGWRLA